MSKRIALISVVTAVVASLAVGAAAASPKKQKASVARTSGHMLVGINDEPDTLYGNPATAFDALTALKVQVLRVNLYWGGNKWAVANKKPADGTDPGDPAYNWALYDRLVQYARYPRHPGRLLDSLHALVGQRRQGEDRRSDKAARSPELRLRGSRAVQRLLDSAELAAECLSGDRKCAAPEGVDVDCLERAEQSDLAHAAVQARRKSVAGRERVPVREDLQRGLHRGPLGRHLGGPGQGAG